MAVGLTQAMLNEKPPDDGHRKNILSRSFTHIGIAVFRVSSGTVWLTQDFLESSGTSWCPRAHSSARCPVVHHSAQDLSAANHTSHLPSVVTTTEPGATATATIVDIDAGYNRH